MEDNHQERSSSDLDTTSNQLTNMEEDEAFDDNETLYEKYASERQQLKDDNKVLFWFISIFNWTNQNFFNQFFSAFARLVGVSATILGFLMSIRNLLRGLFQGMIGRLSDQFGRRTILIIGFFLSFIITIPLIFFESTILLIVVSIVQAFAVSVVVPTWNAVLGDVTQPKYRAAFIGKIASIGRLISVIFTLFVALIFFLTDEVFYGQQLWGWTIDIPWRIQYSIAFGISSFNALLCIICVFLMKETRKVDSENVKIPKIFVAFQDKDFVKFLVINSFFGITMSLIWPLNPIVLIDVLDLSFPQVAIMSASFAIFIGAAQILGGKLADMLGRKPLAIISVATLVFFPVSMIPAIITNNWSLLIISRFVGGIGTGLNLVALNAYVLDIAPRDLMGGYSGLRQVLYGVATFIGSFAAGFIIDALLKSYTLYSVTIAFSITVSCLRALAAFGFIFITESLPAKNKRQIKDKT
ncbi:MAG: MFS transporter [Candidatus Heimdallarchaeota archaeon]|nr:MFS transporter [Candidatus Heimdallarchaeota archaeon]